MWRQKRVGLARSFCGGRPSHNKHILQFVFFPAVADVLLAMVQAINTATTARVTPPLN